MYEQERTEIETQTELVRKCRECPEGEIHSNDGTDGDGCRRVKCK